MKKNVLKSCGVFALSALMAVSALSVCAHAISINGGSSPGVVSSNETTVTVPKGITFINEDAVTSAGPDVTFTYSVAPATVTAGTSVTDANGKSINVKAGPAQGLTLDATTLTFPSSETNTTSAEGIEHTKDISMSVDLTKFSQPGVYRYEITDETSLATLYAAGLTRSDDYQENRFLDVFIQRNNQGNLEVSGYALKTTNDSTTPSSEKDPGFVAASPVEGEDTDHYKTYNVEVRKLIAGTMGDTSHEFPFAITVANQNKPYLAGEGTTASTSATSLSATLKHNDVYTIQGLSPKATFSVVETNDTNPLDPYVVSVNGKTAAIQVTEDTSNMTYSIAAGTVSSYDADNSASDVSEIGAKTNYEQVTYTNTLDTVSPTGLVMRYGAYLFMAIAGIAIIAIAMRKKNEECL